MIRMIQVAWNEMNWIFIMNFWMNQYVPRIKDNRIALNLDSSFWQFSKSWSSTSVF